MITLPSVPPSSGIANECTATATSSVVADVSNWSQKAFPLRLVGSVALLPNQSPRQGKSSTRVDKLKSPYYPCLLYFVEPWQSTQAGSNAMPFMSYR